MNLTTITTWIKNNLMISILVGVVAIVLIFPKALKGLFGSARRKVHHRVSKVKTYSRLHRSMPRSVGMSRLKTIGRIRRPGLRKNKGLKKPWQIKGSLAARRHMALIRKRR